jgi:hypothetical protein
MFCTKNVNSVNNKKEKRCMLRILAHAMYQLLQNILTKFSCITRKNTYMDHVIIGDFLVFIRYVIVNTVTLYPSLGNCRETDPATLVKGGRQKLSIETESGFRQKLLPADPSRDRKAGSLSDRKQSTEGFHALHSLDR